MTAQAFTASTYLRTYLLTYLLTHLLSLLSYRAGEVLDHYLFT